MALTGSRRDASPFMMNDLLASLFFRLDSLLLRPLAGNAALGWYSAAYRVPDDVLMVTATQTLVLVDLEERRAVPIPDAYRERVRAFEGDDLAE